MGEELGEDIESLIQAVKELNANPEGVDEWRVKDIREKVQRYRELNGLVIRTMGLLTQLFTVAMTIPQEGAEFLSKLAPECFVHTQFQKTVKLLLDIQDTSRNLEISL